MTKFRSICEPNFVPGDAAEEGEFSGQVGLDLSAVPDVDVDEEPEVIIGRRFVSVGGVGGAELLSELAEPEGQIARGVADAHLDFPVFVEGGVSDEIPLDLRTEHEAGSQIERMILWRTSPAILACGTLRPPAKTATPVV